MSGDMSEQSLRLRAQSQNLRDRNIETRERIRKLQLLKNHSRGSKSILCQREIERLEQIVARRTEKRHAIKAILIAAGFSLETLKEHDLIPD